MSVKNRNRTRQLREQAGSWNTQKQQQRNKNVLAVILAAQRVVKSQSQHRCNMVGVDYTAVDPAALLDLEEALSSLDVAAPRPKKPLQTSVEIREYLGSQRELEKYVADYFQKSECAEWPSVKQAKTALGFSYEDIGQMVQDSSVLLFDGISPDSDLKESENPGQVWICLDTTASESESVNELDPLVAGGFVP